MEQTVNGARAAVPVNIDTAQTNVSQNIGLELDSKRNNDLNSCSISEETEMKGELFNKCDQIQWKKHLQLQLKKLAFCQPSFQKVVQILSLVL